MLRAVGHAHARVGALDPRTDGHDGIDFRIQHQINAYKKEDDPPKRVKPLPIIIIIYILAQSYGDQRNDIDLAFADIITIGLLFLLRPDEYTGTTVDDTPLRLQDVGSYIGQCHLDFLKCSTVELDSTTSMPYKFTTQKNGIKMGNVVHGLSGNGLCCPVRATTRHVKYNRLHKSKPNAPITSFYRTNKRTATKAKDITNVLCRDDDQLPS
jgi:hypothetical protein